MSSKVTASACQPWRGAGSAPHDVRLGPHFHGTSAERAVNQADFNFQSAFRAQFAEGIEKGRRSN